MIHYIIKTPIQVVPSDSKLSLDYYWLIDDRYLMINESGSSMENHESVYKLMTTNDTEWALKETLKGSIKHNINLEFMDKIFISNRYSQYGYDIKTGQLILRDTVFLP